MTDLPREQWVAVLSKVPEEKLSDLVSSFPSTWEVVPKVLPQSGLGLLKLRDSALGEEFFLGEFPLSSCWISITTESGEKAEGAAWIMDDRQQRVEELALCDAVLSARLHGWQQVADLIKEGLAISNKIELERKSILAKTRVDFSLLEEVGFEGVGEDHD